MSDEEEKPFVLQSLANQKSWTQELIFLFSTLTPPHVDFIFNPVLKKFCNENDIQMGVVFYKDGKPVLVGPKIDL
jgi:hypothetical protein